MTSRAPPFYAGTALNLTCNIPLSDAVDIPVVERIQWFIDDVIVDSPVSSDRISILADNIVFFPVNISDSLTYRCDVHFTTNSGSEFIYGNRDFDLNVEGM